MRLTPSMQLDYIMIFYQIPKEKSAKEGGGAVEDLEWTPFRGAGGDVGLGATGSGALRRVWRSVPP